MSKWTFYPAPQSQLWALSLSLAPGSPLRDVRVGLENSGIPASLDMLRAQCSTRSQAMVKAAEPWGTPVNMSAWDQPHTSKYRCDSYIDFSCLGFTHRPHQPKTNETSTQRHLPCPLPVGSGIHSWTSDPTIHNCSCRKACVWRIGKTCKVSKILPLRGLGVYHRAWCPVGSYQVQSVP